MSAKNAKPVGVVSNFMATKEQYDFFKDQYLDEEKRYSDLTKRGEIYFSILSIVLTGIVFKLKDILDIYEKSESTYKMVGFIFLILAFVVFGIGFYFLANALKIRSYQAVIDFKKFRNNLGDSPPVNEDFFDDRIVEYMYSTEENEKVNEARATNLELSLKFIIGGFFLILIFIITLIIQKL